VSALAVPALGSLPAPTPLLLQVGRQVPESAWDLIWGGTLPTQVVLLVLAAFSMTSWVIIFWKWRQFRLVRRQGDSFLSAVERAQRMEDAYKAILALPDSPYGRVFRQGVNFFSELRPGALREGAPIGEGLSRSQLEVLRMVMEKEEAEERDELAVGLTWLAVFGSVSPLLGLMGTVIGVMNAFLGIVATGSTNIGAVAPGVAEALVTTVAGLFVAIPAVIGYNYFVGRLNLVSGELEGFSSEFIGSLAREGRI
jgi:biopolymer transport protein TolQ